MGMSRITLLDKNPLAPLVENCENRKDGRPPSRQAISRPGTASVGNDDVALGELVSEVAPYENYAIDATTDAGGLGPPHGSPQERCVGRSGRHASRPRVLLGCLSGFRPPFCMGLREDRLGAYLLGNKKKSPSLFRQIGLGVCMSCKAGRC